MRPEVYELLMRESPEVAPLFEWVQGSWRNRGYYRLIPRTRLDPTRAQLLARLKFAKAAYGAFGNKGLRSVGGVLMPPAARAVRDEMRAQRMEPKPLIPHTTLKKIQERAVEARLEEAAKKLAEALRALNRVLVYV